jgi:starch synthase (maltosyl-transferring)
MTRHILIEATTPSVEGGRYPAKGIVGDRCVVEADVFRDGHDVILVQVCWRKTGAQAWQTAPMTHLGNDRWRGEFSLSENTRMEYTIEGWTDYFGTFVDGFTKKVQAKVNVDTERVEGAILIEAAAARAPAKSRASLSAAAAKLRKTAEPEAALTFVSDPLLRSLMFDYAERGDLVAHEPLTMVVDRPIARFSAWYEMFPRSQGRTPGKASTLREAEQRLPDIAGMGFDVVYLPPIHPIGEAHRKGRNNALRAVAGDPGSPWAIGNQVGGHRSVDPGLGTIADFDHFVSACRALGMEVALDYAIQCAPDHPWTKEHPEWFHHRPDGSIKYAENPPKKYEDVYFVNFDTPDEKPLWQALKGVLEFWIEHGVKIFRVDNPHTKPFVFWQWLISELKAKNPELIFLAEAFTRPKVMKALAKLGFSQSYTYFTWRNTQQELVEYLTELSHSGMEQYFRPNFFTNTPDILPEILQRGGMPAFKMRAILAATLSPAYGIYSGFELCENEALPGREEYKDSEKYEIKARDWDRPGNIKDILRRLNTIRRENSALQTLTNIEFLPTDDDKILFFAKRTADGANTLLTAVNLDPYSPHQTTAWVPPHLVGVAPGGKYEVHDLLSDERYTWSEHNYIRLVPGEKPAHILRVERRF